MLGLSLGPGLGYVLLGVIHDVAVRAISWYIAMVLISVWGFRLYYQFDFKRMSHAGLVRWYRHTTIFFYIIFILWTVVFLLFIPLHESNLHYIAIFTQIGAGVVASSLLFSDKRHFIPINFIMMVPLILYFAQIASWYGYVLTVFSCVFAWVLYYAASSSNRLLYMTYYQASHDQLTGLYNRNYFIDAMQQVVSSLRSNNGYSSLLLIDLDHFKTINDSLGHDVGDVMLKEVARRMGEIVPKNALIARMGGDEFIVVGGIASSRQRCLADTMHMAEGLRESLKEVYRIGRHNLHISASIGISILHQPENNANQYIKEADIAMYQVKDKGRDGIVLFGQEISERVERNLQIERLLHRAIKKNEFYLNFQPQFDKDHNIAGCEVLLRWKNDKLGMVSPLEFIPIAEKTGLIIDIGYWVMEQSFKTLNDWLSHGIDLKQLSINVSMRQFFFQSFPDEVDQLCQQYLSNASCRRITFELTESVMAEELDRLVSIMQQLKAQGFSFSIDDFGTGYSSLSFLRKVPLDEIKIDRSFIEEITTSKSDQSMIEMILNLSRVFGLKVVAEGVETQEQEDILLQGNCDLIQGYLLSRPLSREGFEAFFRQRQAVAPDNKE